jgi:hypothetical protein
MKIMALLVLALQWSCTSLPAEAVKLEGSATAKKEASVDELIGNYRKWTRVNPEPVFFHAPNAAACAVYTTVPGHGPHTDKFITVYVNEAGRKAMMEMAHPRFPQGSVILKEKLPVKDTTSPELLTVMIKREAGFNPQLGDWEFMAVDGAGKQVQARGRLENCQTCHATVENTDFVFRNYLPTKVQEKLR